MIFDNISKLFKTANIGYLEAADIPAAEVTDEEIELFGNICKKLRCNYSPDNFANPLLQVFHSTLESLVFNEEKVEVDDLTVPNTAVQDEKISSFIDPLDNLFGKVSFIFHDW